MSDVGENSPRPTAEESEGVFRAIFKQGAVGVAQVVSKTGAFVRINHRYADILGYTVAEMERLTFQQIWVESEGKGRGSTFCFTVPARAES